MGFQKGQPRPANAGRKKGSLNKKTVAKVAHYLAEEGINPAEEIVKLIRESDMSPHAQMHAWFELLSYTQGKPAPVQEEPGGPRDEGEDLTIDDILEIVDVTPMPLIPAVPDEKDGNSQDEQVRSQSADDPEPV